MSKFKSADLYEHLKSQPIFSNPAFSRVDLEGAIMQVEAEIGWDDPLNPPFPSASTFIDWACRSSGPELIERVSKGRYRFKEARVAEETQDVEERADSFEFVRPDEPELDAMFVNEDHLELSSSVEHDGVHVHLVYPSAKRLPRKAKKSIKKFWLINPVVTKVMIHAGRDAA